MNKSQYLKNLASQQEIKAKQKKIEEEKQKLSEEYKKLQKEEEKLESQILQNKKIFLFWIEKPDTVEELRRFVEVIFAFDIEEALVFYLREVKHNKEIDWKHDFCCVDITDGDNKVEKIIFDWETKRLILEGNLK